VFTGAKIGDHMKIGMQPNDAKTWFGAAPRPAWWPGAWQ
jgi:ubiquinol-cytochrome c reductase cytochrome c1 subunit